MKALILRLIAVFIALCYCGFSGCITEHRFFLWNHSGYDLRVIYTLPPSYFDLDRHRFPYPDTLTLAEHTDTVPAGENRMLFELRSTGPWLRNGDTFPMKIFIGDSLQYSQDTYPEDLWEIRRRSESLGLSTGISYTLHVFDADTRQPTW